ncbi:DUF4381 domain-containing protein [Agaribacter marinus]|uniref:DUF4381 domain-containing protein n=1 Tax=Agaribacter marinus TaxID=1431249 RepID=A0AA37SY36_9ALTE|nr:DUF4381 domain-containing protein [Agaribacter marinus]GLR72027.1 hypothetical protein GCM10007852_29350 [Agaribacter marinus]
MNPLDQLSDIQTPDAVSWWPLATGYWVLLVAMILLVILLSVSIIKYRNKRKTRNEAIRQIQALDEQSSTFSLSMQHILKLTIQHYLPNETITSWHSKQWETLLHSGKSSVTKPELANTLYALHESLYTAQVNELPSPAEIKSAAIKWLQLELPAFSYESIKSEGK